MPRQARSHGWVLAGTMGALSFVVLIVISAMAPDAPNAVGATIAAIYLFGGLLGSVVSLITLLHQPVGKILKAIHALFCMGFIVAAILWLSPNFSDLSLLADYMDPNSEQLYGVTILGAICSVPAAALLAVSSIVSWALARKATTTGSPHPHEPEPQMSSLRGGHE